MHRLKCGNSLLAVKDISHKSIVVGIVISIVAERRNQGGE